mgnify:FL=1
MAQYNIVQRKKLAAFAYHHLISGESEDGVRICKCAKCKHTSTIEAGKCLEIKKTNQDAYNTIWQHIIASDYVEIASNGPFIDLKKNWSPDEGWLEDDKTSPQDKIQKSESVSPFVAGKSYKDVAAAAAPPLLSASAFVPLSSVSVPLSSTALNVHDQEETSCVDNKSSNVTITKVFIGPVINRNENGTCVDYVPMFFEDSRENLVPIGNPNFLFGDSVQIVESPDDKKVWLAPRLVLRKVADTDVFSRIISYTDSIYLDSDGTHRYV